MTSFSPVRPFIGSQRNDLRKLARNHPDFDRWRALNDPKNEMKKAEIIKAINDLGLVDEANVILSYTQAPSAIDLDEEESVTSVPIEGAEHIMGATIAQDDIEDEIDVLDESSAIDSDIERVLGPIKPFLASGLVADR